MSSSVTTRTAYVSRLRKAFLLRVHPDRFRTNSDETIRKKQAELVQAINARFELPDFIAYANNSRSKSMKTTLKNICNGNNSNNKNNNAYDFALIKNDGTVVKNKLLNLDDTVDNIVRSMVDVIRTSGASSFPSPPTLSSSLYDTNDTKEKTIQKETQCYNYKNSSTTTSKKYNVKSNQGKDLKYFLTQTLDVKKIQTLKLQRIDASAAALVARHAYKFQSIDGTRIGWSSLSSIKLFSSLLKLHDEFATTKFNVESFYPLRLIFSYDEIDYPLCVYSGTLLLHPASTIMQWLDIFMTITQDDLDLISYHQNIAVKNIQIIQNHLKIKIQKGFSCSGREYYLCLQYLADQLKATTLSSSTITADYPLLPLNHYYIIYPNMLKLIIESKYAYKTTTIEKKTGNIHINSNVSSISTLLTSLNNLSNKAYDIALQQKHKHNECIKFKEILQYKFQLSNIDKAFNKSSSVVTNDQICDCLVRLLSECNNNNNDKNNENDDKHANVLNDSSVRKKLIGQTVHITSSGQFCHIADDGSIVIPWDWC